MQVSELPIGNEPKALEFGHFPTRFQAVVWRNWEMVPPATLARVLRTDEATILGLAADMGLRVPPMVNPRWLERGYVTIIRANWHLLPYGQLLDLLGWDADRLAYVLREEDYLWIKLGLHKPRVDPAAYRELTASEQDRTRHIRETVERMFPDMQEPDEDERFGFLDGFGENAYASAGFSRRSTTTNSVGVKSVPTHSDLPIRPFDLRFLYSYSAVYGDSLLYPSLDPYPNGMLARLAAMGVNAVWLPVILYQLYPWKFGDFSEGWEKRLESLRELTQRAARFGISVMLYLNEPRYMPMAFFNDHPELLGTREGEIGSMCTSTPEVKELLRDGCAWLFKQAPLLGGVFTITMSENLTNCFSHDSRKQPDWADCSTCTRISECKSDMCLYGAPNYTSCPRCTGRKTAEVIAEVNRLIAEGVHSVTPEAPVIAWDWAWSPEWDHEAVELLPEDVWLMCGSEWGLPTCVGGIAGSVRDYSMSKPGPSPRSLALWEHAQRRGLKTAAKIQVNTTFECSALPYLPVPDLVEEHLDKLEKAGVNGLMLSWTLGGYPGGNMILLRHSVEPLADYDYGAAKDGVRAAWREFAEAFREFPFCAPVAHNAPQNVGPKNLLFAEPTGYNVTMTGFPYDDLPSWRSYYPEDVFEGQFKKMSEGWKRGLDIIAETAPTVDEADLDTFDDLQRIATAAYCHFRSTYLQVAFVRRRGKTDDASRAEIVAILDEETELAVTLHSIARRDSRVGFEATNHYLYTPNELVEKTLNCEAVRSQILTGRAEGWA